MAETPSRNPLDQTIDHTRPLDAATIAPQALGYVFYERVGIGGMGEVYRCGDDALNRALAIKVIKSELHGDADAEERFLREARLTGSLQHPGIVPIHQLGRLADGRPYYTMKLIRGRTFADMLRDEPSGPERLPHLLAVVEKVCQAVAYAHSRGVIHRDLKPANVMVGEFGEVQVMDWGLAKELHGGAESIAKGSGAMPTALEGETGEWRDQATGLSRAGAALGTLAYMPPEQAAGDWDIVDERADVFALGAILCEVLTGQTPYHGVPRQELLRRVRRGETAEALERVAHCGAAPALVDVVRDCLKAERFERPRNASTVAERLASYQAEVRERLRQAELQRARAEVKVLEERKRRRLLAGLMLSALLLLLGGGATWWQWRRRQSDADNTVLEVVNTARQLRDQAQADPLTAAAYDKAVAAAQKADEMALTGGASAEVRGQASKLRAELERQAEAAAMDRQLLARLLEARGPREGPSYRRDDTGTMTALAEPTAEEQFASAFREWGLDVDQVPIGEAAQRLKERPTAVVTEVIAALDEWANQRRQDGKSEAQWRRLTELAAALEDSPDSLRREMRDLLARGRLPAERALAALAMALRPVPLPMEMPLGADRARLRQLADKVKPASEPVLGLLTLTRALRLAGELDMAEQVLRSALISRPRDMVLYHTLGNLLTEQTPPRWAEAVEFYRAARSLRPDLGVNLATALLRGGHQREGLALLEHMVEEKPTSPYLQFQHAFALNRQGKLAEAAAVYREAVRLRPDYAVAHFNLGNILDDLGKYAEAEAAYRKSLAAQAEDGDTYNNLGVALKHQEKYAEAEAAYRRAIRLQPKVSTRYSNLGVVLKKQGKLAEAEAAFRKAIALQADNALAYFLLGDLLDDRGKYAEAEAACRTAIALQPDDADAYNNLGVVLKHQRRYAEAEAAYRQAIALRPDFAKAYNNLGNILDDRGNYGEAEAALRKALALQPDDAGAYGNLGVVLRNQKKYTEAEAAFRKASALQPDDATVHNNLGNLWETQRKYAESEAAFRKAIALRPDYALAHRNLGLILYHRGKNAEAEAAFRKAIALQPDYASAHGHLGIVLYHRGNYTEAEAAYRKAIALDPADPYACTNLGVLLKRLGRFTEALAIYRRGCEVGAKRPGWSDPSPQLIPQVERFVGLEKKLPALLRGQTSPADVGETVTLAEMYQQPFLQRYAASARYYADAFLAEPKLVVDPTRRHRYNAACSAALAAAGRGNDAHLLPDKVAAMFRHWALGWLRAELLDVAKLAEANQSVQQLLAHWRRDADLASVRDPQALDRLPAHERAVWQALWHNVDELAK